MTHKQSAREIWAKLVPLNPDKRHINCYIKYEAKNQWRIYQKSSDDTWIINLSESSYRITSRSRTAALRETFPADQISIGKFFEAF